MDYFKELIYNSKVLLKHICVNMSFHTSPILSLQGWWGVFWMILSVQFPGWTHTTMGKNAERYKLKAFPSLLLNSISRKVYLSFLF